MPRSRSCKRCIKATGETEYNGKTQQPTIEAEIQPSVNNRLVNEVNYTKQTQTE